MSYYREYFNRLDSFAKAIRTDYERVNDSFNRADADRKEYPVKYNVPVTDDYLVRSTKAQADYAKAKAEKDAWQKDTPENVRNTIGQIRKELSDEVERRNIADPNSVDKKVVELMETGILTVDEVSRLMDIYNREHNITMQRVVSKFARDAAENTVDVIMAGRLREISTRADDGTSIVAAFDAVGEMLSMSVQNPYMFSSWEELATPVIESIR